MKTLAASASAEWQALTPLHEQTLTRAREIAWGGGETYAGAVVGVYGSGKSTLLVSLLHEASAHGTVAVWEEAAPLIERLLGEEARVSPQTFAERVIAFLRGVTGMGDSPERRAYLWGLRRRGQATLADVVEGQLAAATATTRVVLLLDEVEQVHAVLRRRVAVDDGQPLRALIDGTSDAFRLLLAYAPESFHSLGDADRGRLSYLPVPALDVFAIGEVFGLSRGEASFVWWISRGRARGVIAAVRSVIEPLRRGAFDGGIDDLGDALGALPGVFGVPAIVREGLTHRELRALTHLVPRPVTGHERGIVCSVADREALADALFVELTRRVATDLDLGPIANELTTILAASADEDDKAYLTMDDFRAALRLAEARVLESGRQREPVDRFADQALLAFPALGEMTTLTKRLPLSLASLAEERFPSPFTDPYLPLTDGGRVPSDVELTRALRSVEGRDEPLLRAEGGDFWVFASDRALAAWLARGGLDDRDEPARVVLLTRQCALPSIIELAHAAGRLRVYDVGPFHGTFLICLSLRTVQADGRQMARKVQWHRDRLALLLRETKPQASASFVAARRFVRDPGRRNVLARLKADSPALLALLLPLSPLRPAERRYLGRLAKLLDAREAIRKVARLVNPGGRLSGAAVVVDELLPAFVDVAGSPGADADAEGARALGDLLATFGRDETTRARLAQWLLPEDAVRLAALFALHAGVLPDIAREHDQLGALSQLERTRRRVEVVVADLAACTGRPEEVARALRLGAVTEQARANGGPIEGLASLSAEVEAASDAEMRVWVRTLTLWVCGVFADRLLTGVEKEQADLAGWERAATSARDVGARASALAQAFRALGARACEDLVASARRRVGTHLSTREGLESSLRALRDLCAALEPIAASLAVFLAALRERAITVDAAIATYLPDEEAASSQSASFRRAAELLDELSGPCPAPLGRGLADYADWLRRHAEGSRRERLRHRLEALLRVEVPADLRLDEDIVTSIEQCWQRLPEGIRDDWQRALSLEALPTAEELERMLVETERKLALVARWGAAEGGGAQPAVLSARRPEALDALDRRATTLAHRPTVSLAEVQRVDADRRRAHALLDGLPALVTPAIASALVAGEGDEGEIGGFGALCLAVERFAADLGTALDAFVRLGVAAPIRTAAVRPDDLLRELRALVATARAGRDEALATARAAGIALTAWGDRPAAIAAELDAPQAARLCVREQERLRTILERRAAALGTALIQAGVDPCLLPSDQGELLAWSDALLEARREWAALAPVVAAVRRLEGEPTKPATASGTASWESASASYRERLDRAEAERQKLSSALEATRARGARLGAIVGEARLVPSADEADETSLPALRDALRRANVEVDRLRASRLHEAPPAARAAYAAIRSQHARALPPAVGVLVALGLVVAVEDAS